PSSSPGIYPRDERPSRAACAHTRRPVPSQQHPLTNGKRDAIIMASSAGDPTTEAEMTRYTTIRLSQISSKIEPELVKEADALRPGDEPEVIIVEMIDGKVTGLIDGYHRTAGYIKWARQNGLALDDVEIRVVASDDEELLAPAAEPGYRQAEALAKIYAAADAAEAAA